MSLNKIRLAQTHIDQAYIARERGDIDGAVGYYTKAIELYKEVAPEEPSYWDSVACTIEKVAGMYKDAGKLELAAETLQEAASLREMMVRLGADGEDDEE